MGSGLDKKIISKFENIEYLGFIENPFVIIENSKALITPIFKGAGVKIKVFDALSCGVPVIGNVLAFESLNIGLKNYFYLFHDEKSALVEINKIDKLITEDYIHLKREFYKFYGTPEILNIINRLVYS